MNVSPFHYLVFISEVIPPADHILAVNLTQLRNQWEDHCVLTSLDYLPLVKMTVPAYSEAGAGPAYKFQGLVDRGDASVVETISSECLAKIINGAHDSELMGLKFQEMLPPKDK